MTTRSDYPKCPRCDGPVAGAMMTSHAITEDGSSVGRFFAPDRLYYHPDGISVYCVSGTCNWNKKLAELPTPVPQEP
jgi:hypothetical protein